MKTIPSLALGALLTLSTGIAEAAPWSHRPPPPPPSHGPSHPGYHPSSSRLEVRVQLRLRKLGYYRGPIDGDFGRGSRMALIRFQRDRHLPMTGRFDSRTLRALGLR